MPRWCGDSNACLTFPPNIDKLAKMTDQRKGMKKCPTELKDYIYDLAGALTKYLNGRMELNSNFNKRLIRRDAILMGWRGEYSELFERSDRDIQEDITDIVINQSKDFHVWLVNHLRSHGSTTNIYNKLKYLNWVEWWKDSIETCDNDSLENHFACAIQYNHVDMLTEFITNEKLRKRLLGEKNDRYFIDKFIQKCQWCTYSPKEVIRDSAPLKMLWIILNRISLIGPNHAMDAAAKIGDMKIVKWLHENLRECCSTDAMDNAAQNGHLEAVKWFHENRTEGCTTWAMDWAAHNGHFEIVKWLQKNRSEGCTIYAMDYAAYNGHLEIVKFLHENRSEGCSTNAMNWAARSGNLEGLKWLHENRTEGCTKSAMDWAAENGHLEVLKWLHKNRTEGFSSDARICNSAGLNVRVSEWLKESQVSPVG